MQNSSGVLLLLSGVGKVWWCYGWCGVKVSVPPFRPLVGVEPHAHLATTFCHGAFDDGGVVQHDLVRRGGVDVLAYVVRELAPGGAALVAQGSPADRLFPLAELF